MQNSTTTTVSGISVEDTVPVFLRRFRNLDNLLPKAMATYALPESHKDVCLFVSNMVRDG